MGDVRFVFESIQSYLQELIGSEGFTQNEIASSILQKIKEYWEIMDRSSITSAILDPRTKLSVFSEEDKPNACEHIQAIFEIYQEHPSDAQSPTRRLSSSTTNVTRQFFAQLRRNPTTPQVASSSLVSELDRYLALQIDEETEPLLWWRAHTKEYPIISNMARDYLTIQATSVPSEQAFSIAGNTISKTRNRLLPETARACLCMKSWIVNKIVELGI
jgi:hypothetical protein